MLALDGGLILLPMLRNILRIIRPKLTWLFPADENIWFHRQVAYSMAFWSMVHTTAHYVNFINVERTRKLYFDLNEMVTNLNDQKFASRPPFRFTTLNREASRVTSCCSLCWSCTPRLTTLFESSALKFSGTPTTWHSSLCSASTPMPLVALFETPSNQISFRPSPSTQRTTALATSAGVTLSGPVSSTLGNVSGAKSGLAVLLASRKSLYTQAVRYYRPFSHTARN